MLALVFAQDVKQYGYNTILQNLVSKLQTLENEGIKVNFLKDQDHIRGSLVAISADNLGANGLLGMVESFNAKYFCRICLMEHSNIQNIHHENQVELRTRQNYQEHITNQLTKPFNENTFGIKSHCALNELKFFNTIDAPTIDIMHDQLEAVVQ